MGESKNRGELAEIRTTLAALASSGGSSKSETAVTAKRDVFKKIINYITIGIDMSSLFMQVCLCAGFPCQHLVTLFVIERHFQAGTRADVMTSPERSYLRE